MHAQVDGGNVAHVEVEVGLGSPAAVVVKVGDAQLVGPHHKVFGGAGVVAHAYHHHAHVAETGVAYHGDAVVGVRRILLGEAAVV